MSSDVNPALPLKGPGAPPRQNGELVFAELWEGRAFGIALALCDQGLYTWDEFRSELIAEITRWERANPDRTDWSYYSRWLAALEHLLASKSICPPALLEQRTAEYAARPHGHDHPHPHDHDQPKHR